MVISVRTLVILTLCFGLLNAQSGDGLAQAEIEDPDEQTSINTMLRNIFHPLNIELADSSKLRKAGFSMDGIQEILIWQSSGATMNAYKRLKKKLKRPDAKLLSGTFYSKDRTTKLILRQRLQYSASLDGWRLLSKGRFHIPGMDFIFLIEQDPGESQINDHTVLAVSSDRVPGLDRLTIGDFHIAWGSGLLLNQSSSRLGYSPGSLVRRPRLNITPHYSTRETDYYRGIAAEWKIKKTQWVAFASGRRQLGTWDDGVFNEDLDGIHPSGKIFELRTQQLLGLAGTYENHGVLLYMASLMDVSHAMHTNYELGLQWEVSHTQRIQLFSDDPNVLLGRSLAVWSYRMKMFQITAQYRHLPYPDPQNQASVPHLLGTTALSEEGLSVRLQVRPGKRMVLRYSLDMGESMNPSQLSDFQQAVQQKAQVQLKGGDRVWQFDWGVKRTGPEIPDDVWQATDPQTQITRLAGSLVQNFNHAFQYRLNLKVAANASSRSTLIQQRFFWVTDELRIIVGLVRYIVPEADLRLSIYESNVVESFSFFTAFNDGQRWFIYFSNHFNEQARMEFRLSQTTRYESPNYSKQLDFSFQLSVVF